MKEWPPECVHLFTGPYCFHCWGSRQALLHVTLLQRKDHRLFSSGEVSRLQGRPRRSVFAMQPNVPAPMPSVHSGSCFQVPLSYLSFLFRCGLLCTNARECCGNIYMCMYVCVVDFGGIPEQPPEPDYFGTPLEEEEEDWQSHPEELSLDGLHIWPLHLDVFVQ